MDYICIRLRLIGEVVVDGPVAAAGKEYLERFSFEFSAITLYVQTPPGLSLTGIVYRNAVMRTFQRLCCGFRVSLSDRAHTGGWGCQTGPDERLLSAG